MAERPRVFDVCIVCALYEEASAVIDEFQSRCAISFIKAFSSLDQYEYRWSTVQNSLGEPLTVLVSWLPESGPVRTGLDLKPLLQEFHPRFAAMTGFCAGYKEKVHLGDLVIAEYAYHYEEGKILDGPDGQRRHQPEMKTVHPTTQMIQYAKGFDGWRGPVSELKRRLLKDSEQPERYIAPIASGMAVHADNPFPWFAEYRNRKTIALDMEAATFYLALRAFPDTHALVVKGVCDYADAQKNDGYHNYAARASGVYMLHFIQTYVTEQTMPRRNQAGPSSTSNVSHLPNLPPAQQENRNTTSHRNETREFDVFLCYNSVDKEEVEEIGRQLQKEKIISKPTNVRVTYQPSRDGNKGTIIFVLNGMEHTLEYMRRDNITHQIFFLKRKQQELVRLVIPFATLRPLEKQVEFQIDGVNCLFTFKMSAIMSIMNVKLEVGGEEVFRT